MSTIEPNGAAMDLVHIPLRVSCPGSDAAEVMDLTRNLRDDLLTVDVDDARLTPAGPPPPGAKSAEAITIGALVVTLAPVVVESLMGVIASWLSRQPNDVEVEIGGQRFKGRVSRAERERLVAAYLRHVDEEP